MDGMVCRGFGRQDVERIPHAQRMRDEDVVNAVPARHVHARREHLLRGLQRGEQAARYEGEREGKPERAAREFFVERDEQDGREEEQQSERFFVHRGVHQIHDVDGLHQRPCRLDEEQEDDGENGDESERGGRSFHGAAPFGEWFAVWDLTSAGCSLLP